MMLSLVVVAWAGALVVYPPARVAALFLPARVLGGAPAASVGNALPRYASLVVGR